MRWRVLGFIGEGVSQLLLPRRLGRVLVDDDIRRF